ncbi:MAG TPA: TIGR04282 family arsenosugar biosynthesis glycosyltransferase [Thermoanaerobaculia bacterium]|nr:TIGR04282 family arsenosugar biosynthesis glycosyltransferase [Thermoanaerobaculia bacterium]
MARRLVLYTKPAVPGRVKTRLSPPLSAGEAAELHRAFLDDVAGRLVAAEAAGAFELWSAWAVDPGEAVPPGPGRAFRQEGRDLGERLFRGLSRAAAGDGAGRAEAVAALGSDHPTVAVETVGEAFDRVAAGADVALGPSRDGGYYLIALAAHPEGAIVPGLFEGIDWSTDRVRAQTLERAAALGFSVELLPEGEDVDTPEDLQRLADELIERPDLAALCPRTAELLACRGYGRAREHA